MSDNERSGGPRRKGTRHLPCVNYAAIDRAARPHLGELCARLLPGGRRVGNEFVAATLRGGRGGSCKIRLTGNKAGVFRDFATGEGGRGAVALASAVHRVSRRDAALALAAALGIPAGEGRP
jgi:hypothetical protein